MVPLAHAEEQAVPRGVDWMGMIPLVLIVVIFYFFLIRPQQKKEKQRQSMIAALARGDRVVTTGGLVGTVYRLSQDADLVLELSEGVLATVRRSAIAEVLARIPMEDEPQARAGNTGAGKRVKKSSSRKK